MFKFSFPLNEYFLYGVSILFNKEQVLQYETLYVIIEENLKNSYLKNLRSWFIVCLCIFGHQVNILGHSINTFIVPNL